MIRGLTILLLLQGVGEFLGRLLHLPIPGSVLGMGLLFLLLLANVIRMEWISEACDLLLGNMALFFVPAGVGVMVHTGLIAKQWLPISLALVISTLLVMAATGWVAEWLERRG